MPCGESNCQRVYEMTRMKLLVLFWAVLAAKTLAVAASAAAGEQPSSIAAEIDLDETEEYVEKVVCIDLRRIKRTKAVDNQSMLFYMRDKTVFLNQFINSCPPIRWPSVAAFESHFASRFCQMDQIQVTDVVMGIIGSCNIGFFEEVSAEQAAMILSQTTESDRAVIESVEKSDAP